MPSTPPDAVVFELGIEGVGDTLHDVVHTVRAGVEAVVLPHVNHDVVGLEKRLVMRPRDEHALESLAVDGLP